MDFKGSKSQSAPAVRGKDSDFQLPEGNQWRYSEFVNAVQAGKVERVRFSKEGGQLQVGFGYQALGLTAIAVCKGMLWVPAGSVRAAYLCYNSHRPARSSASAPPRRAASCR